MVKFGTTTQSQTLPMFLTLVLTLRSNKVFSITDLPLSLLTLKRTVHHPSSPHLRAHVLQSPVPEPNLYSVPLFCPKDSFSTDTTQNFLLTLKPLTHALRDALSPRGVDTLVVFVSGSPLLVVPHKLLLSFRLSLLFFV